MKGCQQIGLVLVVLAIGATALVGAQERNPFECMVIPGEVFDRVGFVPADLSNQGKCGRVFSLTLEEMRRIMARADWKKVTVFTYGVDAWNLAQKMREVSEKIIVEDLGRVGAGMWKGVIVEFDER